MKNILFVLGLLAACAVQAQNVSVSINPAVAAPGVKRSITIDTFQPVGCQATVARVNTMEVQWQWVLTIHLDGARAPSGIFCDAIVPFRYVVEFTPENDGELRVLVFDARTGPGAGLQAETRLVTRSPVTLRSLFDLTGMWYDPATNGSGLTFIHAAPRGDGVFGTWFLYDSLGRPRWYTIQNVVWKPGGREAEGALLESVASINICPLTIVGCPLAAAMIAPAGRARIVMESTSRARIEALTLGGQVVFASDVIKPVF